MPKDLNTAERKALIYGIATHQDVRKLMRKYYRSPHWRAVLAAVLASRPICELCRHRKAVQAHHKTYATLFHEDPAKDLDAVCGGCHRAISRR